MLAPRLIPAEYSRWNRRWRAPYGRFGDQRSRPASALARLCPWFVGPFGFQANNTTRRFEYPWAFAQINGPRGQRVVEVGGSLAGFQFVLARSGFEVLNVDPGEASEGPRWRVTDRSIRRLNRWFRTDVTLIPSTLEAAALESESVHWVSAISTIEHTSPTEVASITREVERILVPGGRAVFTVDLFPDLVPFTNRVENEWGRNVDIAAMIGAGALTLVNGDRSELLGYAEFDPTVVLANLDRYLVGAFPALAQCFVLEKPARA